jgi:uncharacterized protein
MKLYALCTQFGADYMEKRAPYRDTHMAHLNAAISRGDIVVAEAMLEGGVESMAIFRAANRGAVEAYALADPYVQGGVAASWRVREWIAVAGPGA